MGYFSELDIEIQEMVQAGAKFAQIKEAYPMLRDDEIAYYLVDQNDDDDFYLDDRDATQTLWDEYQALAHDIAELSGDY